MKHETTWGGDHEDAYVSASGICSVEEMRDHRQELISDPRFRSGMRVLIDHRLVDWSRMTPADVPDVVEMLVQSTGSFGVTYCAMVMGKPVDFGIVRMHQQYAEADPNLQVEFRVFSTVEDARRWFAELPAPASPTDS
jgi:hypothetical protein